MSPISVTLQLLELTANEIVNSIEDLKQSDRFATDCYDDDHSNLGKSFQHIYASARARSKDIETLANAIEKYPIDTDDVTKKMAETARALFAVQEARNELRQKIRLLQQEKQTEFRNSYKSLVDCTIGLRGMLERSQQQHTNLQCCVDRMRDDQESLKANVREMREQLKGPRPVPMERNSLLKPAGNIEPTKNTQEAKHIIDEAWDNKTKLSASIYEDKPVEEDPPVEKLPPPPRVPPERQFNNLLKDRHLSDLAPNSKMVPSPKVFNSKLPSRKVGGSPEPSPETPTRSTYFWDLYSCELN